MSYEWTGAEGFQVVTIVNNTESVYLKTAKKRSSSLFFLVMRTLTMW